MDRINVLHTCARPTHKAVQQLVLTLSDRKFRQTMPPLFYRYYGVFMATTKGVEAYVRHAYDIFCHFRRKKEEVLEVGCGFGLMLICFGMFGSKKLVGVDISKEMLDGFRKLAIQFPELDVEIKLGDWLNMEHEPSSFDVVLLNESISHIRDTDLLLSQIYDVLKPEGTLFISDSNNDLSIFSRLWSRRQWKHAECDPVPSDSISRAVDRLPYVQARKKMIEEAYPDLEPNVAQDLAEKTRGLFGQEILDFVDAFLSGKEVRFQASSPYRNPFTGEFHEKSFNPLKLIAHLETLGFQCELLRPIFPFTPLTSNPKAILVHVTTRPLAFLAKVSPPPLLPLVTPGFWIKAIKK